MMRVPFAMRRSRKHAQAVQWRVAHLDERLRRAGGAAHTATGAWMAA